MESVTVITPAVSQVSFTSADVIFLFFLFAIKICSLPPDYSWYRHICLAHHVSSVS